jgi:hypothetical protein
MRLQEILTAKTAIHTLFGTRVRLVSKKNGYPYYR